MKYPTNREELKKFMEEEVMTTAQVAEYAGVTRQTIRQWLDGGKLEPIKRQGRVQLFLKSDVDKRLKEVEALRKKYRPYD